MSTEENKPEQPAAQPIDVAHWRQVVEDSTPGKYEGENPETAYFHDAVMNGDGESVYSDDCGGPWGDLLETTEEERAAFEAPEGALYFAVEGSTEGFISGTWLTEASLGRMRPRAGPCCAWR